ncbi:hypothetical protein FFK22_006965 [Mycobacterium sp. KBS0706]|nr:hypothetical protein FFK22_006965 [Mycobacterium sp. KBS0706]
MPAPPWRMSLPPRPLSVSLPARPLMISMPSRLAGLPGSVPVRLSLPGMPLRVWVTGRPPVCRVDAAPSAGAAEHPMAPGEAGQGRAGADLAGLDVNGDKAPDFASNVTADHALTAGDFVL